MLSQILAYFGTMEVTSLWGSMEVIFICCTLPEEEKKKKKKKKKRRIDLGGFQHFPGRLLLRSFSLLIFFAVPLHCGDILKIRMFEYR